MIATYRGFIRDGKIELPGVALPEGAEVVVVVETYVSLHDQEARYDALSTAEWRAPFVAYHGLSASESGSREEHELTDEVLNALVHESRTG